MIDTNTSLGDLAATGTDARSYQLDCCGGGGRSLAAACEADVQSDPTGCRCKRVRLRW